MAKRMRLLLSDPCSAQLLQAEQWLEADDKRCNSHAFQINLSHGKVFGMFGMHNCWKQIKRHPTSSNIIQHHPTQENPRFLRGSQRPLQGSVRLVSTTRRDQSPEAGPESTWFSFGPKPSATCRQRKRPCQQWTRPETCNFLLQIKQFEVRPFEAAFLQTTCDVCLQLPTLEHYSCNFLLWRLWL